MLDDISLSERLRAAVAVVTAGITNGGPGLVKSVSGSHPNVRLRVQPMLSPPDIDGVTHEAPDIYEVPLLTIGGGGWRVEITPGEGDIVWLLHSDRSLDEWKSKKSVVAPRATRTHAQQDAVAIPLSLGNGSSPELVLRHESGTPAISLTSTGVEIAGNLDVTGLVRGGTATPATAVSLTTHTHPVSGDSTLAPNPGT